MNTVEKDLIIIAGPTASGKTRFAIELANEVKGELISADSRQIYKYLNIGTNKGDINYVTGEDKSPSQAIIDNIPIHLIDFLDPNVRFNVFEWRKLALQAISQIKNRGSLPILVGGTGLYIDSLVKKYDYSSKFTLTKDQKLALTSLNIEDLKETQNAFKNLIPKVWNSLNYSDQNNLRRLQRLYQKLFEEPRNPALNEFVAFNYEMYYPDFNWEVLKTRIDSRVDQMFDEGLVDETKLILNKGFKESDPALQIMGYKEVISYLKSEISLDECIRLVKIAHKQYARRQRTWFEGKSRNYTTKPFS